MAERHGGQLGPAAGEEGGGAVFALSAGLCGTMTLAQILNTASNARAYYRPEPHLAPEALAVYRGMTDGRAVFESARRGLIDNAWRRGLIYGEMNYLLTAMAPAIAELIPAAKFLVIVRSPWLFARSAMRRGYYDDHPWDRYRLRPTGDSADSGRWEQMDRLAKVCWLWNETYLRIAADLKRLPQERYLIVRLEAVLSEPAKLSRLFDYLGLAGYSAKGVETILARPLNADAPGAFALPEHWTDEQAATLLRECEGAMDVFGLASYRDRPGGGGKGPLGPARKRLDERAAVASAAAEGNFRQDNLLNLALAGGERCRDYMDLDVHLLLHGEAVATDKLLQYLQVTLHSIIEFHCNGMDVPEGQVKAAQRAVALLAARGFDQPLGDEWTDSGQCICRLHAFLAEALPRSDSRQAIEIAPSAEVLARPGATDFVRYAYAALARAMGPLWDEGYLSCLLVHGSLATMDFTPFSDIDTQLFLTDKAFAAPEALARVTAVIQAANGLLRLLDGLQHHGYFIATDLDRRYYPEAFLPLSTMALAARLFGEPRQEFCTRPSEFMNRAAVWKRGYFFRTGYLGRYRPGNPFEVKRLLSHLMLMPALCLELWEDRYPYKRESFELARAYFPPEAWEAIQTATRARRQWHPHSLMRFSDAFYRQAFEFGQAALARLKELPDG